MELETYADVSEMSPTFTLFLGDCVLFIILTPGLPIIHIRLLSSKTQAQTCMYRVEHIYKSTQAERHHRPHIREFLVCFSPKKKKS